jgi:predicted ATPase/class 3 adenylate cyclase
LLAALAPYLPREVYDALSLTGGELPGDFRRVTSIFVGFEGIRYDSPDVGQALQDYFRWAQDVVARFEVRVNHVITGDKGSVLHILFGAPGKHDDDLIRALRCALALKTDTARPAFITSQRIGITSGIVLARPIGSELRREYTVIGDEINLSSRLMTASAPGDILVDSYTRDRTAQSFVFETLPPLQIKGKQFPVKAYRLMAEREITTSLTARYLASRWTLVGRDAQRAALLAAADRALAGHGNVIAISGRAGVGKTRLVEEVVRRWVDQGGDGYIGQCMSHGLHSPYLPWIDLWREFFGFQESDDAAARFQKVESVIAADVSAMSPWAGVLGSVLGLPGSESPAVAALDAADRRRKLFELALELLRARAARRPLLLLFEDVHWADRPSLDLIDYIAAHTGDVPLLLCLCFRPRDDLDLQAMTSPDCTQVLLEELGAESSAQMVRAVLNQAGPSTGSGQGLPPEFEREIFDKTQGNPLFVEELLSSLIESGVLERAEGGYRVVGDLSQVRVPDTLQDLIMARIDRLDPSSRDLLQVASVIDRRFAYEILRGIYPYRMADLEMRDRLEATIQVDLTRLDHPEPELAYLFKHAMTYDVAYNSLPFARRRELHDRVGDFLELAHLENLEQYYPVLARHFAQSERWDKTLVYALAAGSQAQELYANDEALSYYEQAERCLDRLPAEMYWINALRLYLNRAQIYRLKGQYDLCETDINRAMTLAQEHDDKRAQAEAYNLLAEMRWWQGQTEEALRSAQRAYDLANQSNGDAEMLTALYLLSNTYRVLGRFDEAMAYFNQAYDLASQRSDQVMLGMILNAVGGMHLRLGRFDKALEAFYQALSLLEAVDLKHRMASCLTNIGIAQFRQGQPQASLDTYQHAVKVGLAGGWLIGVAYTYYEQAEALSYLGQYTQAMTMCDKALSIFHQANDALGESYIQLILAGDICLALGLDAQAGLALTSVLHTTREFGDIEQTMVALLRLVEYHLRNNDLEAADSCMRQVNELDQAQLPVWELPVKEWLEGRLALAHGDFEHVNDLIQVIEQSIEAGGALSLPGPMWLLRAQVALARNNRDLAQTCYEHAIQAVQVQSSFANKQLVLKKAGAFLAADLDAEVAARGRQWLEEAEAMQRHLDAERERYTNLAKA